MPRMPIDEVMQRFPFYAIKAMGTDDLIFESDDTLWSLRQDPLRFHGLEIDEDLEWFIESLEDYQEQ